MTAKTRSEPVIVARDGVAKDVAGGIGNSFGGATFRAPDIQSPNPNYRWRIVPPAGVQRSTDGGTTWAIVDPVPATTPLGAAVALSAGFSPSPETCWLVGRAGLVLLSTDGASWQRRAFPEQVDLTGVRASDAQRALVTTTDGRQFATTDGGVTWVLVK
ncbi:MAG: WD40/YVTN/BNR-like repeat-containing protein [Vicinamibacterales bacterium]